MANETSDLFGVLSSDPMPNNLFPLKTAAKQAHKSTVIQIKQNGGNAI
jgi:hypothetical protein